MGLRRAGQKGIAPRHLKHRTSIQPSQSEAAFPIGEYMVPASDSLGRSLTVTAAVAPQVKRMASVILGKGLFGFKTQEDIWRYCIDRGLVHLSNQAKDDDVTSQAAIINSWVGLAREHMQYAYYLDNMREIEKSIMVVLNRGNVNKARVLAEKIFKEHDRIEDPDWRAKYRKMAKRILDRVRDAMAKDE